MNEKILYLTEYSDINNVNHVHIPEYWEKES